MSRKLPPGKLVIATHNVGKLAEIAALLAPFGMECQSAGELGLPEPEETGTTFAENAVIKAQSAAQLSGLPALADDSGLMVDVLDGQPGVYTADWAERQWFEGPPGRDWYLAMGKVEGKLAELGEGVNRSARFVCMLALGWPDGTTDLFEGNVPGELVWPPRGLQGFGYDPVFQPEGHAITFGEMDPKFKQTISHRAAAFAKFQAAVFE